jgi:hypothetical protein
MNKVDYQKFCPQGTPEIEREKIGVGNIYSNSAQCALCSDVIRSTNKHDFVWCKCGAIAVDGGSWYAKRVGNMSDVIDLTEMYE